MNSKTLKLNQLTKQPRDAAIQKQSSNESETFIKVNGKITKLTAKQELRKQKTVSCDNRIKFEAQPKVFINQPPNSLPIDLTSNKLKMPPLN